MASQSEGRSGVRDNLHQVRRESFAADMAFIAARGLDGAVCYAKEVPLLTHYPFIELHVLEQIYLGPTSDLDLSNIAAMTQLTQLTLNCEGRPADLRRLDRLEELEVVVGKLVQLPLRTPALRKLRLRKFSPQPSDLTVLPDAPLLDWLWIGVGSVAGLQGIERFSSLEEVRLAYLPKLVSIGPLASLPALRSLHVEACRNVGDMERLGEARSLEVLHLQNKSIPSVAFLEDLSALREVNLTDTNVLDGDLTPLLRIPKVHFVNRKHYSHTRTSEKFTDEYGNWGFRYGPMVAQPRGSPKVGK